MHKKFNITFDNKFFLGCLLIFLIISITAFAWMGNLNNQLKEMNQFLTTLQLKYEENILVLEQQIDELNRKFYSQSLYENESPTEEEIEPLTEEAVPQEETIEEEESTTQVNTEALYSASYLKQMGVIIWNNYRWTWYSQRVLPGGGLNIPGRHVDENGYVCDENGRICLASGFVDKGTIVNTPFGKEGCVYDYCATANTYDVYTDF